MRGYRDRDYLLTKEEYFFCVVGSIQPENRVIAYLKYVPNRAGRWGKGGKRFKRVLPHYTMLSLLDTFKFLEDSPHYLYFSKVLNIEMTAVPLNYIKTHLKPEEKVDQLLNGEGLDSLQKKAIDLIEALSRESRISINNFGVSGSILLDIHQSFSDIDLLVYGARNTPAVKKALLTLYEQPDSYISRFDEKTIRDWCDNKTKIHPLTREEAETIYQRKWGRGLFYGTKFSVHPVKLEDDVSERYGDRVYKPKGLVRVEAAISDDSEAGFLPAVYKVEDVRFIEGSEVENISEIVSYEGLYGDLKNGERIIVKGKLERIEDKKTGEEFHRVLVGSPEARGRDYIKPLRLLFA